ncbi:BspA family leucine-rich repeat surface protein, partial [Enterococcus faecalis]|uniref:BspA family leucine-rich repeat surface protein n=1 Tax=Enterococcus faecalis TaxID=1351 RepID=UPI001A95A823
SDIVVPNEIDGKPTKIDLSSGIKTPNLGDPKTTVTSITFDSSNGKKVKAIGSGIRFSDYNSLTTFDGKGLDITDIKNLYCLFYRDSKLKKVDLSSWDTSSVNNMERAFQACSALASLDLSTWNVAKVETMACMFQGTTSLTSLNLSNWNTPLLKTTSWMFVDSVLKELDLTMLNVSNITNMSRMFYGSSIEKINLSTWNPTQTNIDMSYMFTGAAKLREVDMRRFTNLDAQTTTNLLGTNQAANPIVLIVQDSSGNTNFLNRDFVKESGCSVYSEFPKLIANGGKFEDGSNELSYIKKICVTPEQLTLDTFEQFKNKNIPSRHANFLGWKTSVPEGTTIQNVLDLINAQAKFIAQWDNIQEYVAFAYDPIKFNIPKTNLGDVGEKNIPIEQIGNSYNVGVWDMGKTNPKWTVYAQLKWKKKPLEGTYIQTSNKDGMVYENLNDGTTPFDPTEDLEPAPHLAIGTPNAKITSNKQALFWVKKPSSETGEEAVYDYPLGKLL